jgi:thiamine-monophosphate kinase
MYSENQQKASGESQLIKRITATVPTEARTPSRFARGHGLRIGIGDDAAVLRSNGKTDWVVSCDAFLEGVHFHSKDYPPDSVGYKSLTRATSDLAAMGATPRLFLLTLALPSSRTTSWLDKFLVGMARAARQLQIRLVGGDTSKFPLISISITVLGEIENGRAVTRAGARPGDLLYVSGALGRAELGLELMRLSSVAKVPYRHLLQPHLYPHIKLKLGAWLARHRLASAMMDISDGLSTDLARLCDASGVGARLFATRIPHVQIPAVPKLAKLKLDPLQMALHGGEDYELLFTVPRNKRAQLRNVPGFRQLAEIGEITREKRITVVASDGAAQPLNPQGWDPFRNR